MSPVPSLLRPSRDFAKAHFGWSNHDGMSRDLMVRDARRCRAPHHEGLRPHPEEPRSCAASRRMKPLNWKMRQSAFSVAFAFGCDLIRIESEIAKVNRANAGEASFGPNFRPRDHWGRRQWLRHRARCGGPGQLCFPL